MSDGPDPRRVLIIKPSSLGDIVHALPVLAAVRRTWPSAEVSWLVGNAFADLLRGHPLIHDVIPFDRSRYGRMWRSPAIAAEFCRFLSALRKSRFDLVIDLQALFRSGFIAWATGAARRIGPADAREFASHFYTQRIAYPPGVEHAVDKNLAIARAAGLLVDPVEFPLAISPAAEQSFREKLSSTGGPLESFAVVTPGARWPSKQTPPARFAQVIDATYGEHGLPIVLLGAKSDEAYTREIVAGLQSPHRNLVGRTTLAEMVAGIAQSRLVLCHDSGPMHIAAALNKPLVALFGPTDERKTGPYGLRARVVTNQVACRPCLRRVCPLHHHACLAQIDIGRAAQAVRELRVIG